MADEKTVELLKHTLNELERVITDEREETGGEESEADKEETIVRKAEEWQSDLESTEE